MARRIAFLGCATTLPGSPTRRSDAFEHDLQFAALCAGLAGSGVECTEIDWRAPLEALTGFDLALLGSAWDYTSRKDEFLGRLTALEAAGVMVCNPAEVVRWNGDKRYLQELETRGAPSIPTLWVEAPTAADIAVAFDHFGCERLVVKHRVGSGSVGQESFVRGAQIAADWSLGQAGMIQPFLPAIESEGEYSFVFIDGALSHALNKRAAAGDYRIQTLYGGHERAHDPSPAERAAAEAIMRLLPFAETPLYARIDMVRGADGQLALIEAELIEPYLYPEQGPELGAHLARAVLKRLS